LARRLGHPQILGAPQAALGEQSAERTQLAEQLSEADRAISLLGLEGSEPTARYRILFVFHALPASSAQPSEPAAESAEPKK
jgi:hypothetical protein